MNQPTNKNKPANWTKNLLYSIFVYVPTASFQTTGCAPALRMIPKLWILKASARLETDLYIGCSRVIVQPISKANYQDTVVHSMGLSSLALNVSGLPVNNSWLFISITGLQACAYEVHVQELMFDSKPWETDTWLGLRGHPTQPHDASSSTIPTREAHRMSPSGTLGQLPPAWWDEHSSSMCSSLSAFKIDLSHYCNSLLDVETISLGT